MNKRLVIILVVLLLVATVGSITAIVLTDKSGTPSSEPTPSTGKSRTTAAIIPAIIGPLVAIMASANSPTAPITNLWHYRRHLNDEKRARGMDQYMSRRFRESHKYRILSEHDFVSVKKVFQADVKNPGQVTFVLKDGREYFAIMVNRDPLIDGKGHNKWVVDDIRGNEFGS